MDATTMTLRLSETIDARDWEALARLLHDDFVCRYVRTGEVFDREAWCSWTLWTDVDSTAPERARPSSNAPG